MIYLASPYSSDDPAVKQYRHDRAAEFVADFFNINCFIFSPIVYCHTLSLTNNLDGTFETWQRFNFHMLTQCMSLWVLQLEGWDTSKGVTQEISWAKELNRSILYFPENTV